MLCMLCMFHMFEILFCKYDICHVWVTTVCKLIRNSNVETHVATPLAHSLHATPQDARSAIHKCSKHTCAKG